MKTNKKKHTIERKMQISKVDETYCVLRYTEYMASRAHLKDHS